MLRWTALGIIALGLLFLWLTRAPTTSPGYWSYASPDPGNGEMLFHAGSCAACHEADLSGGLELKSDFGTFRVPNISPDAETGIGGWSEEQFLDAMLNGVSPDGQHYYPSFPYTSYTRMRVQDVVDLKSYIDGLSPVRHEVSGHELKFPWSFRRGIGLWKRMYLDDAPHLVLPADGDPELIRGRYLVEGPGHCTECHTERDKLGAIRPERWLAGAPNLDGEGKVPNITPGTDGLGDWSARDIAYYLATGTTPEFDTVGGSMVAVQENLSRLSAEDQSAIVAYLKAIPPRTASH